MPTFGVGQGCIKFPWERRHLAVGTRFPHAGKDASAPRRLATVRIHELDAALGVGAIIVCVLACRPEFSPDGRKVVFPVMDRETEQIVVMLQSLF